MKRLSWIIVVALIVSVGMPAFAGEKAHKKCDGDPDECLKKMQAKIANKAWLGIEMDGNDDGRWQITKVVAGSPAEKAGFQKGDVLMAMNGVEYSKKNKEGVSKVWSEAAPGSEATYVVLRQGGKVKLQAQLAHVPEEMGKKWIAEHMAKSHGEVKMAKKAD